MNYEELKRGTEGRKIEKQDVQHQVQNEEFENEEVQNEEVQSEEVQNGIQNEVQKKAEKKLVVVRIGTEVEFEGFGLAVVGVTESGKTVEQG